MGLTVTGVAQLDAGFERGETVLLDGGMGTELEARGVPMDSDAWSAVANLEHQGTVEAAHADFLAAGADVVIANTFACGRFALEAAGIGERFIEANRRGVEAALRARERAGRDRPVAVAGSMSPLAAGSRIRLGERSSDELLAAYRQQAATLADAGVDLIVTEMIQSGRWHGLAVRAAVETGLPTWLGVSAGRTELDGRVPAIGFPDIPLEEVVGDLAQLPLSAVSVMHTDVDDVGPAVEVVRRHWEGPVAVYPHRGTYEPPNWTFHDIDPDDLAACARGWMRQGASIIGGCCGIRPHHIQRLHDALRG